MLIDIELYTIPPTDDYLEFEINGTRINEINNKDEN